MKTINLHTHDILENENELSILNLFPEKAEETIDQQPDRYFSVGLHPWQIDEPTVFSMIGNVEKWAQQPSVVAIGEIGLDRKCTVRFPVQEEVVLLQLKIAEKLNKPVIWHVVKAYSDVLLLKKKMNPTVPWILHGFNAKDEMTASLVKQGFYFSFGAMLMNEASKNAEMLRLIPREKLFLENDESGISIEKMYEIAAATLSLSLDELKQIVNENFLRVFGKREN
ncbi:MAG: TatD family hydrolase [Bacteroidales bacterium]|nr:TatD family hydrolase [Bacteroidales bacterium]MCF8457108.1 TatD family hydrolase [Bacteroidales bacterium]